uniref:Uncharacterized protein n=1 Tax=Romanomermis culicivorax TaxID=13658 RepID=A0A915IWG5_ROMCU
MYVHTRSKEEEIRQKKLVIDSSKTLENENKEILRILKKNRVFPRTRILRAIVEINDHSINRCSTADCSTAAFDK